MLDNPLIHHLTPGTTALNHQIASSPSLCIGTEISQGAQNVLVGITCVIAGLPVDTKSLKNISSYIHAAQS